MLTSVLKKAALAVMLFYSAQVFSTDEVTSQTAGKIQLKLEVSETETGALGLTKEGITDSITQKLQAAGIGVTDDLKCPSLMVRFKSVQAAHVVASFIQVAFFEEAELLRGKSHIQAMTWSQATLLTTTKEEFMGETSKTLDMMVAAFIEDYKKAFKLTTPATPAAVPAAEHAAPAAAPAAPEAPVSAPATPAATEESIAPTTIPEQVK